MSAAFARFGCSADPYATGVPEPADLADERAKRLLRRYNDGEADAFGEVAALYYDRLWSVALRMCGNPEDASDALQDALIAAMRGAHTFRGDSRVSTWLHRIVVNACLDSHRKRKRHAESPYPEEYDTLADPRNRIEESELSWQIEQALARLPVEQRAAIVLVEVEGWPVADAATILGVPAGTVKSRCSRGRSKLATELAHLRNHTDPSNVKGFSKGSGSADDRG